MAAFSENEAFKKLWDKEPIEKGFRFASIFLPGGWKHYQWIESFVESFDRKFSEDRYFKDISWESALSIIQYLESAKSKKE